VSVDWSALLLLGAYHGLNPGMGWLFAVALGMQQGDVRGVYRALPPIAIGHTSSVAMVLLIAAAVQMVVQPEVVRSAAAAALLALGLYKLWRHRHPRYGGMRVGFRELAVWSFLMASAHGAGLMVLPFAIDVSIPVSAASMDHSTHGLLTGRGTPGAGAFAVGAHALSYFAVMSTAAWVVYRKVGLAVLRTTWFDMDRIWAAALLITGASILLFD
jgi:hypothetical protein